MTIAYSDACRDPNLFGPWFSAPTWATWRVVDKAMFGERMTDAELMVFRQITGRDAAPDRMAKEAWFICGRRSGKDVKAASLVVYLATIGAEIFDYRSRIVRGERGVVQCIAVDRRQTNVILGYVRAMMDQPLFARMVVNDTSDGIELDNGLAIEVTTNDKRSSRGRTVIGAVFDEVAFWQGETSTNADKDVYDAVRPSMATIPNALLIGISSPYARRGLLWKRYREHYGKPGSVLVVKAPTWVMNPTIQRDGEFLTEAFADDPASAAAEFGAEFRTDIEGFVSRETVEAVVALGVRERPRMSGISYTAFVDPSGGSADSFTLAIAHKEGDRGVLDVLRETKPPFSPESVVTDYAKTLKGYGISRVVGDRYAGEWPRERFREHGITYEASAAPKSDLYRDLLPTLNSARVDLLDIPALVNQLVGLERKTSRAGRDIIDHAPNAHDDVANAVAGALVGLVGRGTSNVAMFLSSHHRRPA